jgi:tetratricopeptide (TPR) repeat protein
MLIPRCAPGRFLFLCLLMLVTAITSALAGAQLSFRPADPLNNSAFDHFYNMDYARSISEFEQVLQKHPDDPFAVNHLLTAVLFQELYRMGALNSGEYANDSFVATAHRPADPKVQARIKALVEQARSLEEKRLAANANDVEALYARGVTRGQLSTYTALVERSWYAALKSAVGARKDHEQVLELSPSYTDAKLIVGAHNYVLGSLPWGVKILVKVIGQGGNKDKGIRYLREAAAGSGETSTDAKIVLLLFLRREHKYPEALDIADALVPQYPQNLLIALEQGNLLRASGHSSEAASAYQKILQSGRDGLYPDLHYELAALSLGDLLRAQKDYAGAASAYEEVNQIQKPDPEVSQKANLGAGEMYDVLKKRELALQKYQAVVATNVHTAPAETARKRMKEAYRQE